MDFFTISHGWGGDQLIHLQISELLTLYQVLAWESKEIETKDRKGLIESFANEDISITGADYAIADTGSVVLMNSPEKGRSVSLLPSIHIIILRASQLVTRMGEALAEISKYAFLH